MPTSAAGKLRAKAADQGDLSADPWPENPLPALYKSERPNASASGAEYETLSRKTIGGRRVSLVINATETASTIRRIHPSCLAYALDPVAARYLRWRRTAASPVPKKVNSWARASNHCALALHRPFRADDWPASMRRKAQAMTGSRGLCARLDLPPATHAPGWRASRRRGLCGSAYRQSHYAGPASLSIVDRRSRTRLAGRVMGSHWRSPARNPGRCRSPPQSLDSDGFADASGSSTKNPP